MGIPGKWEILHVAERFTAAFTLNLARGRVSAKNLRHFDVDQVRRVKCLSHSEDAPLHGRRCARAQKNFEGSRSIDDDHRPSRSARTARAGGTAGRAGERPASRARSSSTVGRSARRRTSPNK